MGNLLLQQKKGRRKAGRDIVSFASRFLLLVQNETFSFRLQMVFIWREMDENEGIVLRSEKRIVLYFYCFISS